MSEPEKTPVSDATEKSVAAKAALAETGSANSSSEGASDIESLPQHRQLERVPRSQRRGILSSVALVPEVTNPYEYSNGMKWLFTTIVVLAGMTSSTGSSIFYRKHM